MPTDWTGNETPSRLKAALYGLGQWLGEAVIGLIPLALFEVAHRYSTGPVTAICPEQKAPLAFGYLSGCTRLTETPSQEICILAVVISGLAILSTHVPGPGGRPTTIFTRLLVVAALLALIFGSLLYAFYTVHLDKNADELTYIALYVALLSSFFLAIEGAMLSA
jgi:hypothetical protein